MAAAIPPTRPAFQTVIGLDILRLCAALMVVFYHIFFFSWVERHGSYGIRDVVSSTVRYSEAVPFTWWGWIGVQLFFVISGFVITMSAFGKNSLEFATGRFSRLFPALLFFSLIAFSVVVGMHILPPALAAIGLAKSVFLFPIGPWIDGVVWTLTIEVVFYSFIFLLLVSDRLDDLRLYARAALSLLAVFWLFVVVEDIFSFPGWMWTLLEWIAGAYFSHLLMITSGPFFLLGIFAFEAFRVRACADVVLCLGVTMFCCLASIYHSAAPMPGVVRFGHSEIVPMCVWLTFVAACGLSLLVERRCEPGPRIRAAVRRIGLMTYPLYLVHDIPGGFILGRLYVLRLNRWVAGGLTVAIVVLFSYIFSVYIEARLQRMIGIASLNAWVRARRAPSGYPEDKETPALSA